MERAMELDKGLVTNDRQLACARINSPEGQDYLAAMAAAANYAWVNRSAMGFLARQTFAKVFESSPDDLDMHVVYDVSHNIAKIEEHVVDGKLKTLLVHRKGATRAFPPHHPLIPVDYQFTGQPVLVGGTMGSWSYILAGQFVCRPFRVATRDVARIPQAPTRAWSTPLAPPATAPAAPRPATRRAALSPIRTSSTPSSRKESLSESPRPS